jgi:hypothetical protein
MLHDQQEIKNYLFNKVLCPSLSRGLVFSSPSRNLNVTHRFNKNATVIKRPTVI